MLEKTKKITVVFFVLLLAMPLLLWMLQSVTGKEFDTVLSGYTDKVEKPVLSAETVRSGELQKCFSQYLETELPLRGVYTKNYNTLQYYLFDRGKFVVGKNHSIIAEPYICEALANSSAWDYSLPENASSIEATVGILSSINRKLNAMGKFLYVYITPGKAEACPQDIPEKYLRLSVPEKVTALELTKKLLEESDVPHFFCDSMLEELEYPAFYPTGIHWSRTYEQKVSQRVVAALSEVTGQCYRNIALTGIEESRKPFWRDADLFSLLNIWGNNNEITYYQYRTEAVDLESGEPLRAILCCDSFGEGLLWDRSATPGLDDYIIETSYSSYAVYPGQEMIHVDDWNEFDWQTCLDLTDMVIVEICPINLVNSVVILQPLDTFLNRYMADVVA